MCYYPDRRRGCRGRDPKARSDIGIGRGRIQQASWLRRGSDTTRLRALRSDLIDPIIAVHSGRVVKRTGDGAIVEFRSVVDAVRCAIEVQNGMVERNAGLPPERRIEFRIGIHLGDVVEESDGDPRRFAQHVSSIVTVQPSAALRPKSATSPRPNPGGGERDAGHQRSPCNSATPR